MSDGKNLSARLSEGEVGRDRTHHSNSEPRHERGRPKGLPTALDSRKEPYERHDNLRKRKHSVCCPEAASHLGKEVDHKAGTISTHTLPGRGGRQQD